MNPAIQQSSNPGRILLIFPTRGRPWSALAAIASVMQTAAEPDKIEIAICQDNDDPLMFQLKTRPDIFINRPQQIRHFTGDRRRFVAWCNEAFIISSAVALSLQPFSHIAWLADDLRFRTPGWDNIVRSHPELLVYGRDGYQDEKLATHPFIRTELPRALGYLVPPALTHYCADGFNMALAKQLGSICYDPSLVTEHLHPDASKAAVDQTYLDAREFWDSDLATFAKIKATLPQLAASLRSQLNL